jgi:hypothetical protein
MVEIRFEVADGAGMHGLLESLGGLLGRSSVSCDHAVGELRVCSQSEVLDINGVIDAVEAWLAADGSGSSASLWIGDRCYTMAGSARLAGMVFSA